MVDDRGKLLILGDFLFPTISFIVYKNLDCADAQSTPLVSHGCDRLSLEERCEERTELSPYINIDINRYH